MWSAAKYNFSAWQPQVVVVNICTNDMYSTYADAGDSLPSKEKFGTAYMQLLTKIRTNNPDAHIICAIGPMLSGSTLTRSRQAVQYAIEQFGDSKVSFLEFAPHSAADGYGALWHPSKITQQKMANVLTEEIKRITGWE